MTLKDTDLAYMAGYIDGEGCIRMGSYSPKLSMESCNPHPMRFFNSLFPTAEVKRMKRLTNKNKPVYRIEYNGINAIQIMSLVLPYLIEKKDQAEKLIQIYRLKQELKEAKQRKHK